MTDNNKQWNLSAEIVRCVRAIEIQTRRLLNGSMTGVNRSGIKGSGLEFDQIREYVIGDDVRYIDWNATSRLGRPLVKEYIEERSRTILIALDVSQSTFFGVADIDTKKYRMAELATVMTLVAHHAKDRVGLMLFSDDVEYVVPPARGMGHAHRIIEALFSFQPTKRTTNIAVALDWIARSRRKDTIAFLVSDFIGTVSDNVVRAATQSSEMVAVMCSHRFERALPCVGLLSVVDPETGVQATFDTRVLQSKNSDRCNQFRALFRRYGVRVLDIDTQHSFVAEVIKFFNRHLYTN